MTADPRYLLDTNICIYVLDGAVAALRRRIESTAVGMLATSTIVLAELLIGIRRDRPGDMARLQAFLAIVPPLDFDEAAARTYAQLPFRRGRFDRLIAAQALSRGLTVVTANAEDFADIPGLAVEDWTR